MTETTATPTLPDAPSVLRAIPEHLDKIGWCQGADHNGAGAACLRGAICDLAPDPQIRTGVQIRLALHLKTSYIRWNDSPGRTLEQVQAACREAAEIANLRGADLRGANLRDANLGGADLGGAYLGDADLRDANYSKLTVWPTGFDASARGARDATPVTP
jgi:hypothetical protein